MPSRSANSRSDRARPAASSSNQARPRTIALISVGSHLERSLCIATPGSTSLISTPRRRKATGAVSSIELSLGFSDAGDAPANDGPRLLSSRPFRARLFLGRESFGGELLVRRRFDD